MTRHISISTEVYAAIWSKHEIGDNNEDDILRRILGFNAQATSSTKKPESNNKIGFHDSRNSVFFEEGFKAFRMYKGTRYEVVIENGCWLRLDTATSFSSLNQLNETIVAGAENVWRNWFYIDENNEQRLLTSLRKHLY